MIEKDVAVHVSARAAPRAAVLAAPALGYLLPQHERAGLIVAVTAAGGLLALAALRWPTGALGWLLVVSLLAAGSYGWSAALAATLLVVLPSACRIVLTGGRLRPAHVWIGLLACVLVVSYRLPAAVSPRDPATAFDIAGLLAGLALLAVVIATAPRPGVIARVIALAGAAAAGYALACGDLADGRLAALGFNPNYLGGLLALPCVAAVGLARRTRRAWWLVPAAACLAAIAATQSRGAFVAAAAGAAVALTHGRTARTRLLVAGTAVALALGDGLGLVERLVANGRQPAELAHDTAVRHAAAEFAVTVAARHPLRGIGLGTFPSYAAAAPELGVYIATHDDYLRLAAEAGAPALVAFLALLWLGMSGPVSGDLAVLRAVTAAYAVALLFSNPLANLVASMPFWLSLGCLLAARADHGGPPGGPAGPENARRRRIALRVMNDMRELNDMRAERHARPEQRHDQRHEQGDHHHDRQPAGDPLR